MMEDESGRNNKSVNRVFAGERFSKTVSLSQEQIAEFALLCGDMNPLHHDPEIAERSRFKGIIASGPHTTALFAGMVATHFSQKGQMLGLEFSFCYHAAVTVNMALLMSWEVVKIEHKASLDGDIVWLEGTVSGPDGEAVISGEGKILVTDTI